MGETSIHSIGDLSDSVLRKFKPDHSAHNFTHPITPMSAYLLSQRRRFENVGSMFPFVPGFPQ